MRDSQNLACFLRKRSSMTSKNSIRKWMWTWLALAGLVLVSVAGSAAAEDKKLDSGH